MQTNQASFGVTEPQPNYQQRRDPLIGRTFFNKYVLKKKLGEGSFGKIYQGDYGAEKFALKLENRQRSQSLLEAEAYIINYLKGRKHFHI